MMMDREDIVTRFKRNGHALNKNSLETMVKYLASCQHQQRKLQQVIDKINEMVIVEQQQFNQSTLRMALSLLSHRSSKGQTFKSYQQVIDKLHLWTIFNISPYETSSDQFFIQKPSPDLFEFKPENLLTKNLKRFKEIKDYNHRLVNENDMFIGVLFISCSIRESRNRLMLQNQTHQIQIIIPQNLKINCFLISGCTYIVKGQFRTKDFQLTAKQITLPQPLPSPTETLCRMKFNVLCENIISSKKNIQFTTEDFRTYNVTYSKAEPKYNPIIIFGNFTIKRTQISRINRIVSKFKGIQCIIFLLSSAQHEKVDLSKEFPNSKIYLVPQFNSQGPRILPKIPILRHDYNVTVLSNPARVSIYGQQCVFVNYPIIQNIHSNNLASKEISEVDLHEMAKKTYELLISQNNVGICNKIFWKQSEYFSISRDDLLFICDKACPLTKHQINKGGLISIGNFQRDGDFVAFFPKLEDRVQICEEQ